MALVLLPAAQDAERSVWLVHDDRDEEQQAGSLDCQATRKSKHQEVGNEEEKAQAVLEVVQVDPGAQEAAEGCQDEVLADSEEDEAEEHQFCVLLPPDRQTHPAQQNQTSWVCQVLTVLERQARKDR